MAQRKGEDYVATRLRAPNKPLIILPRTLSDTTAPAYGRGAVGELDDHLARQDSGEPVGERIVVTGRVLDGDSRPVRNSLVVRDQKARQRMISSFDLQTTRPEWALGYRFDIVLEGREATTMENHR
jgi:protocatechuate 3,4-dioxygenase beta subunit